MTRGFLTAASIAAFWVLTAAVLIFVGLTGNALLSANDRLESTDQSLTSVRGHTDPLTFQVHTVNSRLVDIEAALQPLHGQADQLNPILSQVQATLTQADPKVTSVNNINNITESRLQDADRHARSVANNAAAAVPKVALLQTGQVPQLNSLLGPIVGDLNAASSALSSTSQSLLAACNKIGVLGLLAAGRAC
ncbi:MAG: hypothetical protein ABR564_08645 [Candidatus Dormibacteria bacterium]